jgi:hypothetical protein
MNVSEWIAEVDQARQGSALLARGAWHGYLRDSAVSYGANPMRGEFFLVRWALPTIGISSDSREELYELAYMVESALAEAAMGGSRVDDHA